MMSKSVAALAMLMVTVLWNPSGLQAQSGATGAIKGTATDPKGNAVSGAVVIMTNTQTGLEERRVTTNDAGGFDIPSLAPSTYSLEIKAPGFATVVLDSVGVRMTETAIANATLQLGDTSETVRVYDVAVPVDLSSAMTGETIDGATASTLPLSTRNFLTLLTLSAGANTELFDSAALGRGPVTINVNGQRPTNNNYQLEGINSNDFNLPILDNVPLPNPDTVEEFKTQTSLYDASYGRNGGGNIQVNLKGGTSEFHGNGFEFFRNNALNANDFFFNASTPQIARPVLRQNQFGDSFGGPVSVVKDLFFFLNYQGTREASGFSSGTALNAQIPVLPAKRDATTLAATFLPGFSASQIDQVALNYLNLPASKCPGFNDGTHCIPTVAGTPGSTAGKTNLGTVTSSGTGKFQDDQFVISVDKQETWRDKISGRFFFSDNSTSLPFETGTNPNIASGSSLLLPQQVPASNRFFKLGWTRVISSNIVNDARVGLSRFRFALKATEPISLADIGASRGNSAQFPGAYQLVIAGGGQLSMGLGSNDDRGGAFNTFYEADDLTIAKRKHIIQIGGDLSRYQLNRFNNVNSRGAVYFLPTDAGESSPGFSAPPAPNGFQNFLLGRVSFASAQSGLTDYHFRALDAAGYVQDDWKLRERLALNLGLRWEGLSTAHELNNLLTNFHGLEDGTPGPVAIIHPAGAHNVGTPGVSGCTLLHCFSAKNFAPRFSFAWDLFGDHKTAIRSGYGVYYQRISNQTLFANAGGGPFSDSVAGGQFFGLPPVTPENPFPGLLPNSAFPLATEQSVPQLVAFNGTTGAPIFGSVDGQPLAGPFFYARRNLVPPYAQHWNFGVQRDLTKGWVAELGYVGTRGSHLLGNGRPGNAGRICTMASPCVIPASIGSNVTVPSGTPFVTKNSDGSIAITGSTKSNVDARVDPHYLGLQNNSGYFTYQDGSSTYHGLHASLIHRSRNGLYFQTAYSYSKSVDNISGAVFGDEINFLTPYGDLLNPGSMRAVSDFDRRHRLVVSYRYELPFTKLLPDRGPRALVTGWAVNGVSTFQSGTPVNVFDGNALTLQYNNGLPLLFSTNFATLAPGATLASAIPSGDTESRLGSYLNLSAFVPGGNCVSGQNVVVPCTSPDVQGHALGNVGRNAFRGPAQQQWDLSATKNTKINESYSIDFRAELFNAFNHPVFSGPGSGSVFANLGTVDVSSGTSRILTTANRPRIVQFALRLNF
jgi:hypothetical protein